MSRPGWPDDLTIKGGPGASMTTVRFPTRSTPAIAAPTPSTSRFSAWVNRVVLGRSGRIRRGSTADDERDEYDRLRRRVLWSFPSGLHVVGSRAGLGGT